MTNRQWFFHVLKNSAAQRKGRVFVASASVAIAAAVVTAAIGLSLGIRQKLGGELKAYGANAIASKAEGYMDESLLSALSGVKAIESYSGQLYQAAAAGGVDAELMGIDLKRASGWKIKGSLPGEGETLLGVDIQAALRTEEGGTVVLSVDGREVPVRVSGFIETGGAEDRAVVMSLYDAQGLTGLTGKLSAVLIRAASDSLDETVRKVSALMPGVTVKTLRQVAYAEESFLSKVELLMALVTLVVVVASGISVSSTMGATVLERIKEIGLMKAIGGTKKMIGRLYLMEAALIGLAGGAAGYALGFASAQAVSMGAFKSYIAMPFYLVFLSLGLGLLIAVLASGFPLGPALRQSPSAILRGE
ncbi:MAG: ABC transporter permease [Thermodesulfovibrionales bacterium]|nr:ABC transporter permease [Thermodesulfovibrionales bacterium]